jgi:hypothetical protein
MSVLDLILKHDPRVRLLWEKRCDCAQGDRNPLVCAIYSHQDGRYLYLPPLNGRHAATGTRVRREAVGRLLVPGAGFAEIVDCKRCHIHYAVSSAPLASAFLAIRMGPPAEDAFVSHGCEPLCMKFTHGRARLARGATPSSTPRCPAE